MTGYIPPNLRNRVNYTPKKLSLKPKPIDWTNLKTKGQLFEEYRLKNYGKADTAWNENSYHSSGIHHDMIQQGICIPLKKLTESAEISNKSVWCFHNPKIYH